MRKANPLYIAPGTVLGVPITGGNTNYNNFIAATTSGGLVAGLYDVPCGSFFQLNDVINSNDLNFLFDQYRINKVTMKFTITAMATTGAAGAGGAVSSESLLSCPTLYWYVDQDDAQPPSPGDVRERMGVRSRQLLPGRSITITCRRPRSDLVMFNNVGTSIGAGIGRSSQWIDMASMNIPHFGLKWMLANFDARPTTGSVPTWQIMIEKTYHVECKQVR